MTARKQGNDFFDQLLSRIENINISRFTSEDSAPEDEEAQLASEESAPITASVATPYAIYRALRGVFEDDWRAEVSENRPWPVILLHGTGQSKGCWQELGTELRSDGWAVFAPDFGHRATGSLKESMEQLSAYIRVVLRTTGGRRAILVGHSQGGLLATLLSLRHPTRIKHVVCLAAPNHGTSLGGIAAGLTRIPGTRSLMSNFVQSYWGTSGLEQLTGSALVLDANRGDITAPGVSYTCIATKHDQLINPPSSCFLNDGGTGAVRNLFVQDEFPQAIIRHEQMAHDHRVRALVREDLLSLAGLYFPVASAGDTP